MPTIEYAVCTYVHIYIYIYIYIYICRHIRVYGTVSYRANLFTMPGMQRVAYVIDYKVIRSPCCNQLLFTAYHHD